jgi:hypothetical protein
MNALYGVIFASMANGPRAGYLRVIEPFVGLHELIRKGTHKGMRATRWTEGYSMAKKAPTEPMECQPAQYGDAMPVAAAPTTTRDSRAMATALADNRADMVRRRSLQMQRQQIETARKVDR